MAQLTLDQVLRLDIIKLLGAGANVTNAKQIYDFVIGDTAQGTLSLTTREDAGVYPPADAKSTESSVEPGVKRTRRTKAEIEAAAKEPQVNSPEYLAAQAKITEVIFGQPVEEEPKIEEVAPVDYKEVQMAVLNLVRNKEGGKELVIGILEQFGIPTALELKPEQYAEALELLTAAFNA